MTLHELLESAQLDALGLLDAEEQDAFERAFAAASPSVREQIRREQSRLCRIEAVLPDAAPPADLRRRVLSAVSAAAEAEAHADLAGAGDIVAHARGRATHAGGRRVSRLWRASAVGFAAASLIFGITTVQLRNEYTSLAQRFEDDALTNSAIAQFGADRVSSAIFDAQTARVTFAPVDPAFKGRASLWINADWDSARLFCQNLPVQPGTSYKLVALDAEGRVTREIAEFEPSGGMNATEVVVNRANDHRLALVATPKGRPASEGVTVLRTDPLSRVLAFNMATQTRVG